MLSIDRTPDAAPAMRVLMREIGPAGLARAQARASELRKDIRPSTHHD